MMVEVGLVLSTATVSIFFNYKDSEKKNNFFFKKNYTCLGYTYPYQQHLDSLDQKSGLNYKIKIL